jgi:hypothetical protein
LIFYEDKSNEEDNSIEQQQLRAQQSRMSCRIEGEEVNCNSIDVDLSKVEEKHWAYRAIKGAVEFGKSSIVIDSNQLINFLKAAKATFGAHTSDIDGSIRHFFYVSII